MRILNAKIFRGHGAVRERPGLRKGCIALLLATILPAALIGGCAGIVGGQNTQAPPPPTTYSISGTISPAAGGSGATVTLSGGASATTTADSSGNFRFSGLANGTYTVAPSHAGYTFNPSNLSVTVNGANVTSGLNFTAIAQTFSISGTISPAAGGSGAMVALSGAASATTTANSSGAYLFTGLANGTYAITPSHAGYTFNPTTQSVTINGANVSALDFTDVAQSFSVSGTVSPSTGGGGATVTLSGAANSTTTANASGVYTFTGLANGSYTVTPSNAGYTFTPPSQNVTVNGANVTAVNFTATPQVGQTFSISGTISPSTGGGGATVTLSGTANSTTTANASGVYTFTGLANGSYTVTPSNAGYSFTPASQNVTVNGANVTGLNFTATANPTYSISGTISPTAGGSGATVSLSGAGTATMTLADSAGNYIFSGLANGTYTLTPTHVGYTFNPASQNVTLNGANIANIDFTATPQVGGAPNYTTSGNKILDTFGQVYYPHGVNKSGFEFDPTGAGNWTQTDLNYMATWHANIIRIPMNQDYLLTDSSCSDPNYLSNIDAAVQEAHYAGMNVILDLHWVTGDGLSGECANGQQPMADTRSLTFWQQLAMHYKNDPKVFFDLYNEPYGVSWSTWLNGSPPRVGMQQMYNTVRAAGFNGPVLMGGLSYAYDLTGIPTYAPSGTGIIYATHPYDYSNKQPSNWPTSFGFLTPTYPVIGSEFGEYDCGTSYVTSAMNYFDAPDGLSANQMGWLGWAWNGPGSCSWPSLIADWVGTPDTMGQPIHDRMVAYVYNPSLMPLLGTNNVYAGGPATIVVSGLPANLTNVALVWRGGGYYYDDLIAGGTAGDYGRPSEYYLEGSPDGTTWTVLTHQTNNHYHSRHHVFNIAGTGYTQIRMRILSILGNAGAIYLDVHDASPNGWADTFMFQGDSITDNCWGNSSEIFGSAIHAVHPERYPMSFNAGIGGTYSYDPLSTTIYSIPEIQQHLNDNPAAKYIGLSWGTNDSNSGTSTTIENNGQTYCQNMEAVVQMVINAGRIPIIPTIVASPATNVRNNAPGMNACLATILAKYPAAMAGPDLWTLFYPHSVADGWFSDNLHPSATIGCPALTNAWANTMLATVYK
jgi:hypothetical protein